MRQNGIGVVVVSALFAAAAAMSGTFAVANAAITSSCMDLAASSAAAASLMLLLAITTTTTAATVPTQKDDTDTLDQTCQENDQTCSSAPSSSEYFRKDYKPLEYKVTNVSMDFDLRDGQTTVVSELTVEFTQTAVNVELNGDETSLQLQSVQVNGQQLSSSRREYRVQNDKLIIAAAVLPSSSNAFSITTKVIIVPESNTQLFGLYKSGSMYCTQCEPEGFRRITFFPDRPDNMAVFDRVRIEASKADYPVLLSNGNRIETGDVEGHDDRHYAVWSDPYPKPSYLFALVAGNLGSITSSFQTASGRNVRLEIFSEHANVGKLDYAMDSLKRSMKWEEDTFGLEYDLDIYNVVAVSDFNYGAMENKGLNVFNTAYILANPETATDTDFQLVERVVAHEYLHNWTGNRVTCRDWFQLTLKEGLTIFRDHLFSGDMNSNAVKRIEDVRFLRATQFPEDAGPMSHPIRPESYVSIDNFYTRTVYEKGAEVIQMYRALLKPEGFRKGMDLYFERHDGSAVTCDDFRSAMADANGVDLEQFGLWYSTPGTPVVSYDSSYDESSGTFSLTLSQSSNSDLPLHIPVSVGLLDKATGDEVVPTTVLDLKENQQTFAFQNLKGDVVPSILRDFSAPVKLLPFSGTEDEEALAFIAARDTDGFNKWEAGQKLYTSLIFQMVENGEPSAQTLDYVTEAFGRTLTDSQAKDLSVQAYALTLPTESTLAEEVEIADPVAIRKARGALQKSLARHFQSELGIKYNQLTAASGGEVKVDAESRGRRRLRNVLLEYLCSLKDTPEELLEAAHLARNHLESATCMTDKVAALSILASMDGSEEVTSIREAALQTFYDNAQGDALVVDKWFSVQAQSHLPNVLERVEALMEHPDFTLSNPNRFRSLVAAFAANQGSFHQQGGDGYPFLARATAAVDRLNPSVSSRIAQPLLKFQKFGPERGGQMKAQLEWLAALEPISDELYEVVSKGLQDK